MIKRTNKLVSLALALAMLCALAVPAFAAEPDYVTPTGKWYDEGSYGSKNMLPYNQYVDPDNPAIVVVPGLEGYGIAIQPNTIKDPNMKVISLPREINLVSYANGIENCTEIIYRGTKDEWFDQMFIGYTQIKSGRPMFGQEEKFPFRIPVKTLDGEIIDYVGPASAPIVGGAQDKPAESEPTQPEQPTVTFTDVPADAWYAEAVSWAVANGLTNGTSETTFSPNRECTQCECLVFLWRTAGNPTVNGVTLPFTVKNAWATDALKWAYSKGIINNSFDENAPCTRYTAVGYIWQAFDSPTADTTVNFNDIAGLDTRPIAWAVGKGIVNGTSATTFSPNGSCTRSTIATLLQRAYS